MDQWGTLVTGLLGFALFAAVPVALVVRRWRVAGYLIIAGYIMLWPIHLWFWQFELTDRAPLPTGTSGALSKESWAASCL